MAKRLAIEWDSRELRIVAGTVRGERVTVSDIITVAIESAEPQALGETLKRVLAAAGLDKLSGGVALGRGKTELRELKLPPVPEAELPDMVRFQAARSFATAGEKSAIDFIPTRTDSDGIRVVAAAVSAEELKRCALVSVPSQTSIDRLVLRPIAAANLYRSRNQGQSGETILIDLLADDADIVVLRDDKPVFVRSIKLPEEMQVRVRTLAGEVRRSIMACQDSGTDTNCARRVVLWGKADVHQEEVAGLSKALNTDVDTLDPFSLVDVDAKLRSQLPDHVGRLAPLVGLLDSDARNDKELIDFLNPRRAPDPPSNVGRYLVIGAAAAALVGTIFYFGWKNLKDLDAAIAARQLTLSGMESGVKAADDSINRTAKVDAFLDGNVIWLDELRRVALQMPPAEDVILDAAVAEIDRIGGGGSLTLRGNVTSGSVLGTFEESLRDENHVVIGKGGTVVRDRAPYNFSLDETISVPASFIRQQRLEAEDAALVAAMQAQDETKAEQPEPVPHDVESPSDIKQDETETLNEAPTEEAPTEEAPTEEAPTEEAPTEEAPTEESPADEAPAEPANEPSNKAEEVTVEADEIVTTSVESPESANDQESAPASEETR